MRNAYQLSNKYVSDSDALASRKYALARKQPFSMVNDAVDSKWALLDDPAKTTRPYYDYYFAAEDIRVYLAEVADDAEFGEIPMHDLGFNIKQEKAPVYGAFSYTYDGVLRGTRVVTGSFTIVSTYPDYMKRLLMRAASNRQESFDLLQDDYPRPPDWRDDDVNIKKYWGRHIDPSSDIQGSSEWSVHPPFSFVVVYGVQDTSVELSGAQQRYSDKASDQLLSMDQNQRLVESYDENRSSRIILDACELVDVSRSYSPKDSLIMERYEFFARDAVIPPADYTSPPRAVVDGNYNYNPARPNEPGSYF